MSIQDISTVYSYTIGICCLQGQEKERVKCQWDARMSPNKAFWIEATPQNSAQEIDQAIYAKIKQQDITGLTGERCILALFLDLREALTPETQVTLWKTVDRLRLTLSCNFQLAIQFGYVGVVGASKETERANAKFVSQCNANTVSSIQHRLCLVASDVLAKEGGNNWKAVMVYLDMLRRVSAPTNLLPMTPDGITNNDIGFLRYGEYDKKDYDELVAERNRLHDLLSNGGDDKLKLLIQKKKGELVGAIENRFVIRSTLQPQHPEMIVDPGFLNANIRAAQKGKNKAFANAQNDTRGALILTGRRMKEEIMQMFEPTCCAARQILEQLLDEATVGMEIRCDRSFMESILTMNETKVSEPTPPIFAYNEKGYDDEISNYLTNMREHAKSLGLQNLTNAFMQAYDEIRKDGFAEKIEKITKQNETVSYKINQMGTAEQFCSNIAFHGNPPESNFHPISAPGSSMKFLMFRGSEMKKSISASIPKASLPIFEIKEIGGGLEVLDNAPLKALQIVFLDCSEQALAELMPEV